MAKVIDSKKTQLTFQDVMIRRVYDEHEQGKLPVSPQVALLTLVKELEMPQSEAILFGNTLFISHYTEDNSGAVVRMLNVDTARNLAENGQQFVQHLRRRGVSNFVSQYDYKGYVKLFEKFEKMNFGQVVTKQIDDGSYVSCVTVAGVGRG